ncbi:MAG TPA: adenylate/guanylate cyclase domain-containing protein, partial [Calditrichia bacterium]|nr:adenylate/guanylate cyclase domain-containing protein [Calditrichia bacterium]
MDPFPSPVLKYLLKETLRNHRVAFLQVSPRGVLLGKGGWCPHFNLDYLTESHILVEELPFLEGLPFPPAHMILPAIQSPGRRAADVHLVPDEEQVWILFFDPEPTLEKHRQLQQRSNELSLLHEKQSKILDQYLGKLIASGLEQGVLQIKEEGERREITVLFADIRDFTAFSEKNPPGRVFNVLNKYLDSMIRLVLKQGGLIDNIIGDSIMAIFGIIPTVLSPQS